MRLLTLVLLLGGISVFVLQNREPVTLVFFGSNKTTLPIAAWVLGFTAAGTATSLFWQVLNRFARPSAPSTAQRLFTKPPEPFPSSPRVQKTANFRSRQEEWRSRPANPATTAESDWGTQAKSDWNIEELPTELNPPRDNFERTFKKELEEDVATNFEVQQPPKTVSRTGSVYSYSYREAKSKNVDKTDQIHDANYRVITPPDRENTAAQGLEDEEEEDWV